MSEPIRTSAEKREKLATALKRNMARRKAGARVEGSGDSRSEAKRDKDSASIKGEAS